MRVTKLETFAVDGGVTTYHFLKVSTDGGLAGWSEFGDGRPALGGLAGLIHKMGERVVGQDPRRPRRLAVDLYAATRTAAGGLNAQAIAAIENACLDLAARALGASVCDLLGGPLRTAIPVYWSHCGMYRVRPAYCQAAGLPLIRNLDDVEALGAEVARRGFTALKTNILRLHEGVGTMHFPGMGAVGAGPALDATPEIIGDALDLLAAFRRGAGPGVDLILDANSNFRTDGLLRLARALEPVGLRWLEADLPDPGALAAVRRATRTPIGSLETVLGPRAFAPFMDQHAVDVGIIDVMWCGFFEALAMAQLAEAREVSVAAHNYAGPLSAAMSAHWAALTPNLTVMEFDVDGPPVRDAVVRTAPRIENGLYHLPEGPGWGVEIDEDVLRAHAVQA